MDWTSFWDVKSGSDTDFQATGRGLMDIVGFLATIREIAGALNLGPDDHLLDVGCGTGIVALTLSPFVRSIHGLDISPRMIERARRNAEGFGNVEFSEGSILDLSAAPGPFTKVLSYSVLQYLPGEAEVARAFAALAGVLPPGGVALYAANPDPAHRAEYEAVAVEHCQDEAERKRTLETIDAALWVGPERMVELAAQAGLSARALPIHRQIWQHFYMYDLVLRKNA